MKSRMLLPLVTAGLIVASATTLAEDNATAQNRNDGTYPNYGPFIGAGLGYYRINENDFLNSDEDLKDNQTSWRVFGGYEFNRMFALEAGYIDFGDTGDGPASMDADGWTLAVTGAFPVNDVISPYAKIGLLTWDSGRSLGVLHGDEDGSDMFYGFGVRFELVSHLDLQVGYERFDMDSTDLDMFAANIVFRF